MVLLYCSNIVNFSPNILDMERDDFLTPTSSSLRAGLELDVQVLLVVGVHAWNDWSCNVFWNEIKVNQDRGQGVKSGG